MQQCPRCSQNVNPGARFCPHCAYDMSQQAQSSGYAETQVMQSSACANCGAAIAPNAKFCPVCATPIGAGFAGGAGSSGGQNYPGQAGYQGGQAYGGYGGQPGYSDAGYGYGAPARQSSKMPLIIGAIVLVLLIGGGIAAYFLWFNKSESPGSSNTTSSNTAPPAKAEGPGDVTKKLVNAVGSNDRATVNSVMSRSIKTSDVDELMRDAGGDMQRAGGVDTITISNEDVKGDTATVRFEVKYRNGRSEQGRLQFIKEDGAWKVSNF